MEAIDNFLMALEFKHYAIFVIVVLISMFLRGHRRKGDEPYSHFRREWLDPVNTTIDAKLLPDGSREVSTPPPAPPAPPVAPAPLANEDEDGFDPDMDAFYLSVETDEALTDKLKKLEREQLKLEKAKVALMKKQAEFNASQGNY